MYSKPPLTQTQGMLYSPPGGDFVPESRRFVGDLESRRFRHHYPHRVNFRRNALALIPTFAHTMVDAPAFFFFPPILFSFLPSRGLCGSSCAPAAPSSHRLLNSFISSGAVLTRSFSQYHSSSFAP